MKRIAVLVFVVAMLGCEPFPEQEPPPVDIKYLEYTDYYNGADVALKLDILNNLDHTVVNIRIETHMVWENGTSQTFYPEIQKSIGAGELVRSYWLPVATGMVWYQSHDFAEVIVTLSDESEIIFDHYSVQ